MKPFILSYSAIYKAYSTFLHVDVVLDFFWALAITLRFFFSISIKLSCTVEKGDISSLIDSENPNNQKAGKKYIII